MFSGGGNGLIAKVVAVGSCLSEECTFNNALTARVLDCAIEVANDRLESLNRGGNSFAHFFDFVFIFNETQLRHKLS